MADPDMIRAFAGEYRKLATGLDSVLAALDERAAWPAGEDGVRLCELANTLRDGSAFLGFHRLSALARILCDLLAACGDTSPARRRLFVAVCRLAEQLMCGIESRGVEPNPGMEWAHVADLARNQGLSLHWQEPATAPETSDEQRLAALLTDEDVPPQPSPSPPTLAAATDLVGVFVQDTAEILDQAERDLLQVEQKPEAIHDILRHFHTLKGNSGLMGYDQLQRLNHRLEGALQDVRDGQGSLPPVWTQFLLRLVDVQRQTMAAIQNGGDSRVADFDALMQEAASLFAAGRPTAGAAGAGKPILPDALVPEGGSLAARGTVRVSVDRLDQLNDLVGELVIATAVVTHLSEPHAGGDAEQFGRAFHQLNLIASELQHLAMSTRMVPVETVLRRLSRLTRDLSGRTGKAIDLQLEGMETEVDRSVAELIADPLVHMIRNAVDHGLESPAERKRAGKPETGTIRVEARHRSGEVWIRVTDDGRGLAKEKIRARAVAHGLLNPADELSDEKLYRLIFEPGFSTAEQVSEVSGRGVGMDVVRRNIERLHGRVDIETAAGLGTTLTLRIPLTLAVIQGMLVRVGAEQFILPLTTIRELLRPEPGSVRSLPGGAEIFRVRGETLPFFRLAGLLKLPSTAERPEDGVVCIVEDGDRRMGLAADELLGQQRVVVKNIGDVLGRISGVSGASILADGRVRLILDVPGLLRLAQGGE